MSTSRGPLQPISHNVLPTPDNSPSSSKSKTSKLAPIFTPTPSRSSVSAPRRIHALRDVGTSSSSMDPGSSARKRVKRDMAIMEDQTDNEEDEVAERCGFGRKSSSMTSYFSPSTPLREAQPRSSKRVDPIQSDQIQESSDSGLWRRKRGRLGLGSSRSNDLLAISTRTPRSATLPFLSTMVTSTAPYCPDMAPSLVFLPSQHPPSGRARDFSPPLAIAFNSIAKQYDAASAREVGVRRMLAIGGEEGGVRILDVDEGMGVHREEKGWWWRAHGNAVFDVKFSADDSKILTASGDQTTRIHTLDTPVPRLQAILRGHTSSIKTTVFFDPTRSHIDPSVSSSVVASSGRDGNILIYDLRCQGQSSLHGSDPLSPTSRSRSRYSEGISGFSAQTDAPILDPVMTIKGAHGDGIRRAPATQRSALRSVTSLVAMQSMPGMLASGGSYDGIVKLWDLRFPCVSDKRSSRPTSMAYGSLADPTINCSNPSRRPRSVNALVESPTTGDLFALCGDSKIHALRPAYAAAGHADSSAETDTGSEPDLTAILPGTYTDPNLLVSSFYLRASISPDGKSLACGSGRGGVMTWDIDGKPDSKGEIKATRLSLGVHGDREVSAIDWGHDMLAACADDLATRIWRSKPNASELVKQPEWWGQVA